MNRRTSASMEGLSSPAKGSRTIGSSLEIMPVMKDAKEYDLRATMSAMQDVGQLQVSRHIFIFYFRNRPLQFTNR